MRERVAIFSFVAFFAVGASPLAAASSHDAEYATFQKAKYFADLYNWEVAGPLFKQAEEQLQRFDRRSALYAHVGSLRIAENTPILARSQEIARLLVEDPILKDDEQLRLFALTVKGDLDGEIDAAAARKDWTEVIALSRKIHTSAWIYRAEGQLGFCDYYQGDLASSQRRVTLALTDATKAGDIGAQVFFLSTLAVGFANQNMPETPALQYAQQAIDLARSHPDVGEPFIANQAEITLLAKKGKVAEAKARVDTLLTRPNLTPSQHFDYLSSAGFVALAASQTKTGIAYFEQAIAVAKPLGVARHIAELQGVEANIYLAQGEIAAAEHAAHAAVSTLEQSGALPLLPSRLDTFAQILIAENKYVEAEAIYDRAEAIQDSLIGRSDSLISKTAAITGADQLYAHHFALIAEKFHDVDRAYRIAEKGRSRALVELLLSRRTSVPAFANSDRQIAQLRIEMATLHSMKAIDKQREAILLAECARSANPDLAAVGEHPFSPVSIEKLQTRLRDSEAVLEYLLATPRSYVVVITPTSARIISLPSRDIISASVEAYVKAIENGSNATDQAIKLNDLLIRPIPNISAVCRYTIIPDGVLNQLSFDALRTQTEYLVQAHVTTYAPSSTIFYLLRLRQHPRSRYENALLAVGGVSYNRSVNKVELPERGAATQDRLTDLPNSGPEVEVALSALGNSDNRELSGDQATETNVKRSLSEGFGYIHLAVHAFASDDPNQAAIVVLSDPAHGEDGLIEAAEIARRRIYAKLVVLSACDTAVGPIQGQEGTSTLSTAFILAGSQFVISTLWRVQDQPSFVLMKAFYEHLSRGEPAPDALALAKRELLHKFGMKSLPMYWAGFVIQGSEPILN